MSSGKSEKTPPGLQLALCLPDCSDVRVVIGEDAVDRPTTSNDNAAGSGAPAPEHAQSRQPAVVVRDFSNLHLEDLHRISRQGELLFDEFVSHVRRAGFSSLLEFVRAPESPVTRLVIATWLKGHSRNALLDGLGKPYANAKGRWLLAAWVFREAPEQRLKALIEKVEGGTSLERKVLVLDSVRAFAGRVFRDDDEWTWPVIRETFRHRLEGSRRAKLGLGVERMVRRELQSLNQKHGLGLIISDREQKFGTHTVDVVVEGVAGRILMPVKSRTTEGGGHGLLYTRDLTQSIKSVAEATDVVVPIVVAERFSDGVASLGDGAIVIEADPSHAGVAARIERELERRLEIFMAIAGRDVDNPAVA